MKFDDFVGAVRNFLAAVGLCAMAAIVGLYTAGFFDWAAKTMPRLFGWLS